MSIKTILCTAAVVAFGFTANAQQHTTTVTTQHDQTTATSNSGTTARTKVVHRKKTKRPRRKAAVTHKHAHVKVATHTETH
jgi:hypothetical protein